MIVLLVILLAAALAASFLWARKRYVWPSRLLREARAEVVPAVQRQVAAGQSPAYAYRYVLTGPGTADEGDHDTDKLVVRVDATAGKLVTRVAPVDRQGRRTGESRLLLTR